jgi:hypothetical protein
LIAELPQRNLHAELAVVGQNWADTQYFVAKRGRDAAAIRLTWPVRADGEIARREGEISARYENVGPLESRGTIDSAGPTELAMPCSVGL